MMANKNVKADLLPPSGLGILVLYFNFIVVGKFITINLQAAYVSVRRH